MDASSLPQRAREAVTATDLLFATLAGITGVAGSYAVAGASRQFVVSPIDALVVRMTPGPVIAFVIQNIGERGHLLHVTLAIAIAVGLLGTTALVGLLVARRWSRAIGGVALAAVLAWGVTTGITGRPLLALGAAGPVAVFTTLGVVPIGRVEHDRSRRRVIASGAGALTFVGVSVGLGRLLTDGDAPDDEIEPTDEAASTLLDDAEEQSLDIAGDIPGLVSTFEEFYNVDIAQFDPDLSAEEWSLTITGEVGEDVMVSFEELQERPTQRRYITLRCVGEDLNGDQLDTAVWTGTPIKPLLEEADPGGECGCAMLRAEDNYTCSSRSRPSRMGSSRGA